MKQSRDPFEAALEEEQEQQSQHDSPPDSPAVTATHGGAPPADDDDYDDYLDPAVDPPQKPAPDVVNAPATGSSGAGDAKGKRKRVAEKDEEEEEEHVDVELGKNPSSDPDKMATMQAILSQFTEEQMSRYESFRRSVFQKSNMKRLLMNAAGTQKISMPMTIVVSGIAKMFVGELVETARVVMTERGHTGPIRPCHIREAYRRLKLEGKIPRRSVPRLFR